MHMVKPGVIMGLIVLAGAGLYTTTATAADTWADELQQATTFYSTQYPSGNWDPYLRGLAKIQQGIREGRDDAAVKADMNHVLQMLHDHAYGINDDAAADLYALALNLKPTEGPMPDIAMNNATIEAATPMAVPDHTINTPYEGGPPCGREGCDYWDNDVFDPGAS